MGFSDRLKVEIKGESFGINCYLFVSLYLPFFTFIYLLIYFCMDNLVENSVIYHGEEIKENSFEGK